MSLVKTPPTGTPKNDHKLLHLGVHLLLVLGSKQKKCDHACAHQSKAYGKPLNY
jgi:hypothetical protein